MKQMIIIIVILSFEGFRSLGFSSCAPKGKWHVFGCLLATLSAVERYSKFLKYNFAVIGPLSFGPFPWDRFEDKKNHSIKVSYAE